MKTLILSLLCIFLSTTIIAQSSYNDAIVRGDKAFHRGNFGDAINYYFAAEAFDPSKKKEVKQKINRVFGKIEQQKKDAERATAAAKKANAFEFIQEFPEGFETVVGERGIQLSGGQRQLLGLARALYNQPQILLLDEAISNLDRKTERHIMSILQRLKDKMPILLVTHRIITASKSDYIYILENGHISDKGSPDQLVKSANFYSDFFSDLNFKNT